jgi:hypothetical protein
MLIEGTVHLQKKLSTKQKMDLGSDRLLSLLLFKPHKIHFQFIEPEIERIYEMEDVYVEQYQEAAVDRMAADLKKLIIYHTKKRFKKIEDCVKDYVVFIKQKTISFK